MYEKIFGWGVAFVNGLLSSQAVDSLSLVDVIGLVLAILGILYLMVITLMTWKLEINVEHHLKGKGKPYEKWESIWYILIVIPSWIAIWFLANWFYLYFVGRGMFAVSQTMA